MAGGREGEYIQTEPFWKTWVVGILAILTAPYEKRGRLALMERIRQCIERRGRYIHGHVC